MDYVKSKLFGELNFFMYVVITLNVCCVCLYHIYLYKCWIDASGFSIVILTLGFILNASY